MIKSPHFDHLIIFLIIGSTISLAMQKPLNDPNSLYNTVLNYIDLGFSISFGIECILKIIAFGFIFNKG